MNAVQARRKRGGTPPPSQYSTAERWLWERWRWIVALRSVACGYTHRSWQRWLNDDAGERSEPPNLVPSSFLKMRVGREVPPEKRPAGTHQATLYPTCGRASVVRRPANPGKAFRIVETGERAWQRDRRVADRSAGVTLQQLAELDASGVELPSAWLALERGLDREHRQQIRAEEAERSERVNNQRAAAKILLYARGNKLDHLWTLTYRGEGQHDARELKRHIHIFFVRFGQEFGDRPMLMVREPHPDGHGWHLHFGVHGFVQVADIRRIWPHGRVHVSKKRRRSGHNPKLLSRYLAKYVAKGYSVEDCYRSAVTPRQPGEHRYYVRHAMMPECIRLYGYGRAPVYEALRSVMGGPAWSWWCSVDSPEWMGPRVDVFDWWPDPPPRKLPLDSGAGAE